MSLSILWDTFRFKPGTYTKEQLLSRKQLEASVFLTIIGVIGSFWECPFAFHRAHLVYFPLMKDMDSTVLTWQLL